MNPMEYEIWKIFPNLKALAEEWLDHNEQEQLAYVLNTMTYEVRDTGNLSSAFYWEGTPQGDKYWHDINYRIYCGIKPIYPGSVTYIEEESDPGWQPDEAKPDLMDITRSMF